MDYANMYSVSQQTTTSGHPWKLYSNYCRVNLRKHCFCKRALAFSSPELSRNY